MPFLVWRALLLNVGLDFCTARHLCVLYAFSSAVPLCGDFPKWDNNHPLLWVLEQNTNNLQTVFCGDFHYDVLFWHTAVNDSKISQEKLDIYMSSSNINFSGLPLILAVGSRPTFSRNFRNTVLQL